MVCPYCGKEMDAGKAGNPVMRNIIFVFHKDGEQATFRDFLKRGAIKSSMVPIGEDFDAYYCDSCGKMAIMTDCRGS